MRRYMEPLTTGRYPKSMESLVGARLPKLSRKQAMLLNGSFDFLGLNYYTASYAADAPQLYNRARLSYATDSLANLTSN